MVPYSDLDVAAPVALAIDAHAELRWLGLPVKLGAIVAMISVMLVMTVGQARIFMAMAADGLLPSWFASVHPRFRTPAHSTVVTWVGATLIGGLLPVRILGELVSIGTLCAFVTVCVGVLILRRLRPELPQRFRVPAPYFTCVSGALVCFGLMATRKTDWVNNFWKVLAHDPATLRRIWSNIKQVMGPGAIDPLTKEMLYLAVSASNGCRYCIASHGAVARSKGMSEAQYSELLA